MFEANVDDTNTVKVDLSPSVIAQYIRLHPTNCSNRCALRMEIDGCNSTAGIAMLTINLTLARLIYSCLVTVYKSQLHVFQLLYLLFSQSIEAESKRHNKTDKQRA